MSNRQDPDDFGLRNEKDQLREPVDLRETNGRSIEREHLGIVRYIVEPSIDIFTEAICQRG